VPDYDVEMPWLGLRPRTLVVALFLWCFTATVITIVIFSATPLKGRLGGNVSPGDCPPCDNNNGVVDGVSAVLPQEDEDKLGRRRHKLCLIVPYRNRFEELTQFIPHISKFLSRQHISFSIFIVNQVDAYRFNRAALINAGFLYARSADGGNPRCDYIGLHDVDLLPLNDALSYDYPRDGPFHVAAPGLHPRYDYPNFIGAILLLKVEDFERVKGMSNQYWGWGMEDDEFFARLKDAKLEVHRPVGINTGTKDTFKHVHSARKRNRDFQFCYNQRDQTRRRDRTSGFHTVEYKVSSAQVMTVDGHAFKLLNVNLECDKEDTPWCDCKGAPQAEARRKTIKKEDNISPWLPKNHGIVQN
jgi:xylosylprotein 4-beta-galactosyltransferase